MPPLLQITHEPKVLDLERLDDGRFRLVISLKKLGQATMLEFFLDQDDAQALSRALVG